MAKILVIQGPNLNLLGTREPEIYGSTTLDDIHQMLASAASEHGNQLESMQSNAEHQIIERIHAARKNVDLILINPGAFTHTSVAIRDALAGVDIPFIEVHISNLLSRETFRHTSYFSDIARGVITGLGTNGYLLALDAIIHQFTQ